MEEIMKIEKPVEKCYDERGYVGVIVSGGYGAGWSSWGGNSEFLTMDKTLVDMCLNDTSYVEVEEYLEKCGVGGHYMGGWSDAAVEWIPKGTAFKIDEYDGSESLEIFDTKDYMVT
jgi:hypothetical protein